MAPEVSQSLHVTPARHTIRLAVVVEAWRPDMQDFRVVSPPLDITVSPAEAGQAAGWPRGPELAQAVKKTLMNTLVVVQQSLRPEQPAMKDWIADALAEAESASELAENTPLQTAAEDLVSALAAVQQAVDKDPAAAKPEFSALGKAYNRVVSVFAGETPLTPQPAPAPADMQAVETRTIHLNFIDPQRAISVLSPDLRAYITGQSTVSADPNHPLYTLEITGPPDAQEKIASAIKRIDVHPRHVLLDMRVVAMQPRDLETLGIEWHSNAQSASNVRVGRMADAVSSDSLEAQLNQLRETGHVSIISKPRIVAQDGRPARIGIGSEGGSLARGAFSETTVSMMASIEDSNDISLGVGIDTRDYVYSSPFSVHPPDIADINPDVSKNLIRVHDGSTAVVIPKLPGSSRTQSSMFVILITPRLVSDEQGVIRAWFR